MTATMELTKTPTTVSMFRFSAVMWNAHRVHFDQAYATEVEGHPGLLVPAYLYSSYLSEMLMTWGGPGSRLTRLTYRTLAAGHADVALRCWGRQTAVAAAANGGQIFDFDIGIEDPHGTVPVLGTARIVVAAGHAGGEAT